jgi:hypothetical protein
MAASKEYECKNCGNKVEVAEGETAPDCCKKQMTEVEPLPFCTTSDTAEHTGGDDFGEPCDDGRTGKL